MDTTSSIFGIRALPCISRDGEALESVGASPSLLGVGGNGGKLIGAIASDPAAMLPDDAATLGSRGRRST